MDKEIIAKVEELVERISGCYTSVPEDILNELNEITKNDWTEGEYIEFCAEYWSRSTLEETVYALLHGGNYPDNFVKEICLWKTETKMEEDDIHTWWHLGRALSNQDDEDFVNCFEDLPCERIYEWLCSRYSDWDVEESPEEDEIEEGDFEIEFEHNDSMEYGRYQWISMEAEGKKQITIQCCNFPDNEIQDILAFVGQFGFHILERNERL